tara:strand:- start:1461 stop:1592 length:132 start_codon:yes stop_codon:yes gene_type:complete
MKMINDILTYSSGAEVYHSLMKFPHILKAKGARQLSLAPFTFS